MSVICSVDLVTAEKYKGASLKAKYNGKKQAVYLKIICDDLTLYEAIEVARNNRNVLAVEYCGMDTNPVYLGLKNTGVYVGRVTDFGNDITVDDIQRIVQSTPEGVTPIIRLQPDFNDLYKIWYFCNQFSRVRFCGGNLFSVDGVRCGMIGVDILSRLGLKFDDSCYALGQRDDVFDTVNIDELTIEKSVKAESTSKKTKSTTKSSKTSKSVKKPKLSFADIMAGAGSVAP